MTSGSGLMMVDGTPQEPLNLMEAAAREKHWKAKQAELDYNRDLRQLVKAQEVDQRWVSVVTRSRTKILGLPSKFKTALPHLSHADLVTIDRLIREQLEELAAETDEPAA